MNMEQKEKKKRAGIRRSKIRRKKEQRKAGISVIFLLTLFMLLSAPSPLFSISAKAASPREDASVTLEADYGFNGKAREGRYLPISVSFQNQGQEGFSGKLKIMTLESSMEVYQYEYPVELGAGENLERNYYIPLGVENDQLFLVLTDGEGKEIVRKRLKLDISTESATLFVGALTDSPDSLSYLDEVGLIYGTLRTSLIPLSKEDVPSDELGLDQFDLIAVNDFDWNSLTSAQEKAVLSWVKEGGTLLFGTGESLDRNMGRLRDRFLEKGSIMILPQEIHFEKAGEQNGLEEAVSLPIADFTVKRGRTVWIEEGIPLLTKKRQEKGQIILAGFDLAEISEVCSGRPAFLEQIFGYILGSERVLYLAQDQYYSLSNLYYSIQMLINTGSVARLPKVGLYTVVILVYIIVIGPGLYLYLKKKSLQNYYMPSVVATALAFTGLLYAMGSRTRFDAPFFTYATVENYEENEVENQTYINVRSPYNTPYTVALSPDYTIRPITKNYYYEPNSRPMNFTGTERYETALSMNPSQTEVKVRDSVAFEPKLFSLKKEEPVKNGMADGEIGFFDGTITGTVTNSSGEELNNAVLLLYGKVLFLGDMAPGECVDLADYPQLNYPIFYKDAVAQMASGADQYSRTDISDEGYLEAQDKEKLLSFYLESDMKEYFPGARILAFSSKEKEIDFLAEGNFVTEGMTLMTEALPLRQKKGDLVYRCVLEESPKVLSGSYDPAGNSLYVGEPSEPLVLEYFLGNDLEIESLSLDWMSPEFIDNPKYPYLEKFIGSLYFYNYDTGKNDRMDLSRKVYNRQDLEPYLSPSNSITVKYLGESGKDTIWSMSLPVMYVTGREK